LNHGRRMSMPQRIAPWWSASTPSSAEKLR
jgi:hypothetical protein